MLDIKQIILSICEKEGIDPSSVFKRGKPSVQAREIRDAAMRIARGKVELEKVHIEEKPKEVEPKIEKVRTPYVEGKHLHEISWTEELNAEIENWISNLTPDFKKFLRI